MKSIIALVPMKGHSERIPNKNLKNFDGKPLFYKIIDKLYQSNHIEKIAVNTDSKKIAKLCKKYFSSIIIINRPQNLQGDFVSMNKIIKHDIKQFDNNIFLQTHSTNPLLKVETIDNAIRTFFDQINNGFDSLFSVNRIQTRCYDNNYEPINHKFGELKRTQDLKPIYEENSNIYIFSKESFISNNNNRIGKNPYLFEMERLEAIDIDEKKDFKFAERLAKINREDE